MNGSPFHLHRWDWHAGKGIGLCRVETPHGAVDVFSTHLIAQYQDGVDDSYKPYRTAQVFEAAQFIRSTRKAPLCLLMGDLNCPPTSTEFRLLQAFTGLRDAYSEVQPVAAGSDSGAKAPTMQPPPAARRISDGTFGTPENTFASKDPYGCCAPPQCDVDARLDYVMAHSAPGPHAWRITASGFTGQEPVKLPYGPTVSMSDHLAVWAQLEVPGRSAPEASSPSGVDPDAKGGSSQHLQPARSPAGWVYPARPALDKASVALLEAANSVFHTKAQQMTRARCQHIITGWLLAACAVAGVVICALNLNALAPAGWDGAEGHLQYILAAAAPWMSLLAFALTNDCIAIVPSPVAMMVGVVILLLCTLAPMGLAVWLAGGLGIASVCVGGSVFAAVVTLFTAHYITAPKMRAFRMLAQSSDVYLSVPRASGGYARANSLSSADAEDALVTHTPGGTIHAPEEGSGAAQSSLVDLIV